MENKIIKKFKENNVKIDEKIAKNLKKFNNLLIEGNKICNLTAITDEDEVIEKHFLDCIFPEKFFDLNSKVIDIGAGAGFPSIPLKIYRPDLNIVMVDSLNKRINFLNEVISSLGLEKISAIHSRAEELAFKEDFREKFDFATARAVANLQTLCEYCLPFVKIGGKFVVYKSGNIDEEVENSKNAIKVLGGELEVVNKYKIGENDRSIVVIKKIKNTEKKYPRQGNKPKTNPI